MIKPQEPIVTKSLPNVTESAGRRPAPDQIVTPRTKPEGSGRPRTYATNADRQKAYRERRKVQA